MHNSGQYFSVDKDISKESAVPDDETCDGLHRICDSEESSASKSEVRWQGKFS